MQISQLTFFYVMEILNMKNFLKAFKLTSVEEINFILLLKFIILTSRLIAKLIRLESQI